MSKPQASLDWKKARRLPRPDLGHVQIGLICAPERVSRSQLGHARFSEARVPDRPPRRPGGAHENTSAYRVVGDASSLERVPLGRLDSVRLVFEDELVRRRLPPIYEWDSKALLSLLLVGLPARLGVLLRARWRAHEKDEVIGVSDGQNDRDAAPPAGGAPLVRASTARATDRSRRRSRCSSSSSGGPPRDACPSTPSSTPRASRRLARSCPRSTHARRHDDRGRRTRRGCVRVVVPGVLERRTSSREIARKKPRDPGP